MVIIADYRDAPSGVGPKAAEWADKPHRLVYDLCNEVERLRAENETLRDTLKFANRPPHPDYDADSA